MAQESSRTIHLNNYIYSILHFVVCLIDSRLFILMHKLRALLLITDGIYLFFQLPIEMKTDSKGVCKSLSRKLFMQIEQ